MRRHEEEGRGASSKADTALKSLGVLLAVLALFLRGVHDDPEVLVLLGVAFLFFLLGSLDRW